MAKGKCPSGQFEKIKLLHQGNKAELWLVMEKKTQKIYLQRELKGDPSLYQQLQQLDAEGVPRVRAISQQNGRLCIVEEYLQGQNLEEYCLANGRLSEDQVCDIALEVCRILERLHAHQIVHRDIKPANIFMTDDGRIRLIDFDAARIQKEDTTRDTVCRGTRHFAAPEQYGSAQTDGRSDIYALGVTMRVLLGGDDYEGGLSAILIKCTEYDAKRRFQTVPELIQALLGRAWPIGHWAVYYHIYELRTFLLKCGIVLQLLSLLDWAGWREPLALLLHLVIILPLCAWRFQRQKKGLRSLQDRLTFLSDHPVISLWQKLRWWLGYTVFWLIGLPIFIGGLGITYRSAPEIACLYLSLLLPPFLAYFTLRWRLLREQFKE